MYPKKKRSRSETPVYIAGSHCTREAPAACSMGRACRLQHTARPTAALHMQNAARDAPVSNSTAMHREKKKGENKTLQTNCGMTKKLTISNSISEALSGGWTNLEQSNQLSSKLDHDPASLLVPISHNACIVFWIVRSADLWLHSTFSDQSQLFSAQIKNRLGIRCSIMSCGNIWLDFGSNKKVPYANILAAGYLKGYLIHGKWNAGSAKFGI